MTMQPASTVTTMITPPNRPIAAFVAAAARISGVSPAMICGPARTPNVVRVRDALIWSAMMALGVSYSEIGRRLGNRDHSTIRIAFNRASARWRSDADFAQLCEAIAATPVHYDTTKPA